MAASTPSEYIEHHLSFFTRSVGDGDFWSVNVDTMVMSLSMRGISNPASAGGTVAALFRAEASKILVIIVQLWLVLVTYRQVDFVVFFASFVITVLLFRMALLERN